MADPQANLKFHFGTSARSNMRSVLVKPCLSRKQGKKLWGSLLASPAVYASLVHPLYLIIFLAFATIHAAGQATVLFYDDFDASKGTSLTDPASRASGELASIVKYAWTDTADVIVDGILNWDSNNTRNGLHQHTETGPGTTVQNFRITHNWAPQVANKIWEVEFRQRVAWNHPLTFGLSDTPLAGVWNAWNNANYDFAVGSYGNPLFYDTNNDDGGTFATNPSAIPGVFPSLFAANPPTDVFHQFRIRFDEPNGTATVWINGIQRVHVTSLDFENPGRYLSWGEPNQYAGALDDIKITVTEPPPSIATLSPAPGTPGIYPRTSLVVTFDRPITLTGGGSITLKDPAGLHDVHIVVNDPSQVTVSDSNLIITPPAPLPFAVSYEVIIAANTITNYPGTTPGQWTFTTAAQQSTAPGLTALSPGNSAAGVLPSSTLTATFDQHITTGSGHIELIDTINGSTSRTISISDSTQITISGNLLTIQPVPALSTGRTYGVRIAEGAVKNFSEIPFAGIANNTTWHFTTPEATGIVLHEWDVGAAGATNTRWADQAGNRSLNAAGSMSVVFTPDTRSSLGRGFQASSANLNAGSGSGLPTDSYTFEFWLNFGGAVVPGQVIFESGGGLNGIGLWTNSNGLEFATASTTTGSDALASVSLAGLNLSHYVQVVGVCNTADNSITLQVTDVNGATATATAVSAQLIGMGTENGLSFFGGGNGNFSNTQANIGGSSATGSTLPASPGVFSGRISLARVWQGVDLPNTAASYDRIVLAPTRAADPRPNIIVIFTDDHGYADLGIHGADPDVAALTPNFDRLGSEGVRFTSGYSTAPQCVPSRAGILSGRYEQTFGIDTNGFGPMRHEIVTFAERMRTAGYRTGMAGKWHLEPNRLDVEWMTEAGYTNIDEVPLAVRRSFLPDQQGFEEFAEGAMNNYWRNYTRNGANGTPLGSQHSESGHRVDVQSDFAISFIERNANRPFIYYLSYYAPHVPLEWVSRYNNASFVPHLPTSRRIGLSMIKAMDDDVGRILDKLAELGIDDNTMIWFISDNGAPLGYSEAGNVGATNASVGWDGSLNTPWTGEKGMLAEGGIRVPFLLRWPAAIQPQVYDHPVITLDVAATAIAVAGLAEAPELDGANIIPHLTGADPNPPHERLFWRFWNQGAVREGRWKYLKPSPSHLGMLFDLENDRHEFENMIGKFPQIAAALDARLEEWKSTLQRPGNFYGNDFNIQELYWYRRHFGLGIHYEFNTAGNAQGWSPANVTNPRVEGGHWKGQTSNNSTLTQEDFAGRNDFLVAGSAVDRLLAEVRTPEPGTITLQWGRRGADSFHASRSVSLPVNGLPNPQWFIFPMRGVAQWDGEMVTRIRFNFTSSGGGDTQINWIRASDGDIDRDGIDDLDEGAIDSSGNGIPNFLDLDSSGNGQSDHIAWLYGIDPTNPAITSLPTSIVFENGEYHLDFDAIPNRLYTLEESPDLIAPWLDAGTIGPLGLHGPSRFTFTPPPGSPHWFFRLRINATP